MAQGTEPHRGLWNIRDAVTRLRVWGSDEFHELSKSTASDYWIGFSPSNEIPILGAESAHPRYAQVSYHGGVWTVRRLDDGPPLLIDGAPRDHADLTSGMEISIGTSALVAESERLITLRCFLSRLLGWGSDARKEVDGALRRIRNLQLHGLPIVLQGEGSLVPVAHDLHNYLHATAAPFVVCDPHRQSGAASAAPPLNIEDLESALLAAVGGSLCLRNERPPKGIEMLLQKMGGDSIASQIIICDDGSRSLLWPEVEPVVLPSLTTRTDQMDHIIFEYALDVCTAQGASLDHEDRSWIKANSSSSFEQICLGTTRLAALRIEEGVTRASERLDMSPRVLRRWLRRCGSLPRPSLADSVSVESEAYDLDA